MKLFGTDRTQQSGVYEWQIIDSNGRKWEKAFFYRILIDYQFVCFILLSPCFFPLPFVCPSDLY